MRTSDIIKFSVRNLMHRGLRSWLTVIGIVIGIAAVVAIVAIGEGLQQNIISQLGDLDTDIVTIVPGSSRATDGFGPGGGISTGSTTPGNLTEDDLRNIKSIPGIPKTTGLVTERLDVEYINEVSSLQIRGFDPVFWDDFNSAEIVEGRNVKAGDTRVAMIGNSVKDSVFKDDVTLNRIITIEGQGFRVVGILEESVSNDNVIIIPLEDARKIFEDTEDDQFTQILVKVDDTDEINEITEKIEQKLLISHRVKEDEKDFTVTNPESILEIVEEIRQSISIFLTGIASISLIVGSVGIANTMFTSVLERTKLIGILKSLGATNGEIMGLFLTESALIGLVGGLVGVFFGYVATWVMTLAGFTIGPPSAQEFVLTVPIDIVFISLGISVVIGALAGMLPARRAAKMQPVEALRYE